MKRNLFTRCLIGAPIGLSISYIITIIISVILDDGNFHPIVPQLANICGSEINAVAVQAVCSLLYGGVIAGASVIWEKDNWSILRQTLTHCIIISVTILPIAYLMHWMNHSVWGILSYFGIFFVIYFIIWIFQYYAIKKRIKAFNKRVQEDI
ncbi:MAG: DUF3021 domain-containing protein [Ruminococcus sp.]|nr:DUF3021 domain-containing protein [Ruminococcus sp.]